MVALGFEADSVVVVLVFVIAVVGWVVEHWPRPFGQALTLYATEVRPSVVTVFVVAVAVIAVASAVEAAAVAAQTAVAVVLSACNRQTRW